MSGLVKQESSFQLARSTSAAFDTDTTRKVLEVKRFKTAHPSVAEKYEKEHGIDGMLSEMKSYLLGTGKQFQCEQDVEASLHEYVLAKKALRVFQQSILKFKKQIVIVIRKKYVFEYSCANHTLAISILGNGAETTGEVMALSKVEEDEWVDVMDEHLRPLVISPKHNMTDERISTLSFISTDGSDEIVPLSTDVSSCDKNHVNSIVNWVFEMRLTKRGGDHVFIPM